MKRWFVYYRDGYYDDGDVDITSFDTQELALQFINTRAKNRKGVGPEHYKLIEGTERKLGAIEQIVKIGIVK